MLEVHRAIVLLFIDNVVAVHQMSMGVFIDINNSAIDANTAVGRIHNILSPTPEVRDKFWELAE